MVFTSKFVSKNTKTTIQSLVALFFASNSVLWYYSSTQLTQNASEEHFILYILCSNMACRVHSIEYNLRSFFLLFLPPLPLLLSKFSYSAPSALRQKGITDAEARGIYMSSAGKNWTPLPAENGEREGRLEPSILPCRPMLWSKNVQYCRGSNSQV